MTPRRLTGSRCLCRGCGEYFNSVRSFDCHRIWASATVRRCITPDEMFGKGMSVNSSGFWITEPLREDRVKAAAPQISAVPLETPVGHLGVGS